MKYIKFFSIAVITLLAFLAMPNPALAVLHWTRSDGFESNPLATWSCWQSDPGGLPCSYETYPGNAYQGIGAILIHSGHAGGYNGWSDVGKAFKIDTAIWQLHRTLHCQASFYLRNNSSNVYYPDGTYTSEGNLEVIDVPTWGYVSVKPFSVLNTTTYTKITTATWTPPSQGFFIRVGLIDAHPGYSTGAVFVDNFNVDCTY